MVPKTHHARITLTTTTKVAQTKRIWKLVQPIHGTACSVTKLLLDMLYRVLSYTHTHTHTHTQTHKTTTTWNRGFCSEVFRWFYFLFRILPASVTISGTWWRKHPSVTAGLTADRGIFDFSFLGDIGTLISCPMLKRRCVQHRRAVTLAVAVYNRYLKSLFAKLRLEIECEIKGTLVNKTLWFFSFYFDRFYRLGNTCSENSLE